MKNQTELKYRKRILTIRVHTSLIRHKTFIAKLYKEGWIGKNGFGERFINNHIIQ